MSTSQLGPLMIDVVGCELTDADRQRLTHPLVGGLILFARNYRSPEQLARLTAEVKSLRPLPIGVDHEGGRVQRFRDGFTRLPAMRGLGALWDREPEAAAALARQLGFVLAAELRAHGVDLSFTPVLDLDYGCSTVIGDRAFHRRPEAVIALAGALIDGLRSAGMVACGKHFPGHGYVEADSHVAMPVDERSLAQIAEDMAPYRALPLDAVMPAHVIYPQVDARPAGFSPVWHRILREDIGFSGVVFSDDLSMEAAGAAGDILGRANAAWSAGCDMLLVCNAPEQVDRLLANWSPTTRPESSARVARLLPMDSASDWADLAARDAYQAARLAVTEFATTRLA